MSFLTYLNTGLEIVPIDISLGSRPLYCNYSFALKYGKQISEFLVWGQKKYNRILFNGLAIVDF